jgi:hypothetical protein
MYLPTKTHIFRTYLHTTVGIYSHTTRTCTHQWASETGIAVPGLSSSPVLITTLRPCPRGTNGGVSLVGTAASALGGVCVACVYSALAPDSGMAFTAWAVLGFLAGFGGSMVDSVCAVCLCICMCVYACIFALLVWQALEALWWTRCVMYVCVYACVYMYVYGLWCGSWQA